MKNSMRVILFAVLFIAGCAGAAAEDKGDAGGEKASGGTGNDAKDRVTDGRGPAPQTQTADQSIENCLDSARRSTTSFKPEQIKSCYRNAAVREGNAYICDGLLGIEANSSITLREAHEGYEYCIRAVAINAKDHSVCAKLGDGTVTAGPRVTIDRTAFRYGCIDAVANAAGDPAVCDLILDLNKQKTCRKYAAD